MTYISHGRISGLKLSLFWLAESIQWIFEFSAKDVSLLQTLKVKGNHVMCDRGA